MAHNIPFTRWQGLPWGASVDLFFVISGFIMVFASQRMFGRAGARGDFVARRLTRVVPLYWICTTGTLAILALAASKGGVRLPDTGQIAASYLFVPVPRPDGHVFPVFDLGWTLNYEIAFYLLFAVFVGLRRQMAVWAILTFLGVATLVGSIYHFTAVPLYFWTRPIILDFAMGMIVGNLCCDRVVLPSLVRFAMLFGGILLFWGDPFSIFDVPAGFTVDNGWPRVLSSGAAAALVMAGAVLGPQPTAPAWVRPAIYIGNASYSLYLIHPFVLILMEKLVQKGNLTAIVPLPLVVPLTICVALLSAVLSFRLIERPVTAWADHAVRDGRDTWTRRWRTGDKNK